MNAGNASKRSWDEARIEDGTSNESFQQKRQQLTRSPSISYEGKTHRLLSDRPTLLPSITASLAKSELRYLVREDAADISITGSSRQQNNIPAPDDNTFAEHQRVTLAPDQARNQLTNNLNPVDTTRREPSQPLAEDGPPKCPRCNTLDWYLGDVVKGLLELERNLHALDAKFVVSGGMDTDAALVTQAADILRSGFDNTLKWSIDSIESSIRRSAGLMGSSALPTNSSPIHSNSPLAETHTRRYSSREQPPAVPQADSARAEQTGDEAPAPELGRFGMSTIQLSSEHAFKEQRSFGFPPPRQMSQSPYQAPSSPGPPNGVQTALRSPFEPANQTMATFTLPSPSSLRQQTPSHNLEILSTMAASSSPPKNIPPGRTSLAREIHMQDLQHQISQKSLALMTLQREHDTLLAAYSRQQTRCITLDKKSQVSDHEINSLTEEKIRLQGQVESLELQVEDLLKAKDEAHKQNVANSQQYMQIMAMSSKLQARGAEEARKWKAERDKWEQERSEFSEKLRDLESRSRDSTRIDGSTTSGSGLEKTSHSTADDSLDAVDLKSEIRKLRDSVQQYEDRIRRMTTEMGALDRVTSDLMGIRDRLKHGVREKSGESISNKEHGDTPIAVGQC